MIDIDQTLRDIEKDLIDIEERHSDIGEAFIDIDPTLRDIEQGGGSARPDGIDPSRSVGFEDAADFIADASEDGELLFVGAGGVGWVVEAPVVAVHLAGKRGADLVGIAADGDDGFDRLGEEFVEVL